MFWPFRREIEWGAHGELCGCATDSRVVLLFANFKCGYYVSGATASTGASASHTSQQRTLVGSIENLQRELHTLRVRYLFPNSLV